MADEPNWQPADTPPWLQQGAKPAEPNWQPAEDPPWAKKQAAPAAPRSTLERAGSAVAETAGSAWEAAKRLVVPPSKEEAQKYLGPSGVLRSLKETGESILSPITGTLGAATAGVASPVATGVSELARVITGGDPKRSEEMYEHARPMAEAALGSVARMPGVAGAGRYPMPDPVLARTTKVPAKGAEAEAGRFLESQAKDPAALRQKLNVPPEEIAGKGDRPTTFEHTGDLGIAEQERAAARRPGQVSEYQLHRQQQVQAQLKALEDLQPGGVPSDVSAHLRRIMEAETAQADQAFVAAQQRGQQAVQAAQQQGAQAVEQLGGTYDPTTYGNVMRRSLQDAEEVTRAYERELWGRIDPNLPANPRPMQELERRIYGVMPEGGAAEASLSPAERTISGVIQNFPPQGIPFSELRILRSTVSAELRKELSTNGSTPAYARLSQLRGGIEDAIATSVPAEVYAQVRAATQASAQRAQTFRAEGVKQATRREGVQGPYKVGEASVPEQFIKIGPGGYDRASNYLRAVGQPGLEDFADAVAAKARRTAINPDGTVNPGKLQTFLRQHQETLRAIDERDGGVFSARLRNLETAQEAMETAEVSSAATVEAAQANRAAIAKKYKDDMFKALIGVDNDADASNLIGGIFGKADRVTRAQNLMRRLTTPEAREGARAAVTRYIRERLLTMASANDDPVFRSQQFQKWVAQNKDALGVIMDPAQVQNLENISRSLQRAARLNQTKAKGGGSDTVQMWLAEKQQQGAVREMAGKVAPHLLRAAVHSVAATVGGWPGFIASGFADAAVSRLLARQAAKRAATEEGRIQMIQEMVDEALRSPEKARELLGKTHTFKSRTPGARTGTAYRAGVLGAEVGREDEDERKKRLRVTVRPSDKKPLPREAGGGVPAIGGTGGRSPGTTTPAGSRAVRAGAGQALQDGGEAREQQSGSVGFREKMAALLRGTPTAGSFEKLQSRKPLQALSREDVRRTLQQFGISGEAAGGFGERQLGEVDSRATGGGIDPDYPTGERRTNVFPEDPSEEPAADTFEDRFGNWRSEKMGHQRVTVPNPVYRNLRDAEDRAIGNRPLVPGEVVPNPMWFGRARAFQTGGILKALERSLKAARGQAPIKGLPQKPLDVGGEKFVPGPSADVREAAEQYMREKGLPYTPVQNYVPVDEPRARAIARAYDLMKHNPDDPAVREAYEALANETRDQYEVIRRGGAKFEPIPAGKPDPYGATPRLAAKDFLENRHMYYFPTEQGFGSEASGIVSKEGQKMLEPSGVKIAGKEVPFNDLFRIVHDVFGHHKEGVGFRAAGEENAWRSHGRMYSPKALPAMTAETRGQNSWVNYGPYAAQNKGASAADTVYAPQKLGILPQWVIRSGRMTPLGVAGAAAALEEGDRDAGYADGGGVDDDSRPPMPDAVMDAWGDPWERAAGRTARAVRPQSVTRTGREEGPATQLIEDVMLPKSPLDLGLMVLGGPFRWPIKAAGLAAGALMEPSEAEAGVASKLGRKAVPAAGRTVTRSHNMPPEPVEAPFPQYAEDYPPVGPPTPKPKTKPKFEGETYPSKTLTPEGEAFMKARTKIMRDMEKKGFTPYFDPTQRTHVDPANYPPPNVDTSTLQPKKAETVQNYLDVIDMPATKELLRDAYARGKELGDANDWYAMAQLEKAYIQELGMKAGRQAFLDEFAVPMAATTSGNDPRANLLMAHYFEYLRKKGEPIPEGHQFPATVGGRRPEMNIRDYEAMRRRGGYGGLGAGQPKMHDFSRSFVGDLSHGVVDEQMAEGMLAHHAKRKGATKEEKAFPGRARKGAYGLLQRPLHEEAAAAGVEPGRYQDIAWAGFKNEPGKPMIQIVNEAIERTHRLTGMSRDEIVRRGIIRKEIPIYGLGAAGAPSLLQGPSGEDGSSSPTPGQSTL